MPLADFASRFLGRKPDDRGGSRKGPDSEFMIEARKRFDTARKGWQKIREDAITDLKMATGDQWNPTVRNDRLEQGLPVLTFNRLAPFIQTITNRVRQQRPQPQVNPVSEGADQQTADVLEGILRHIHYASQADVAYDCAVEYSATCGWGFYEITTEYTDDQGFEQEPRIRRIRDPLQVYFDPAAVEPDFSDAKWCFIRTYISREEYEERFGKEPPVPFDGDTEAQREWFDKEYVWIAQYWTVGEKTRTRVGLADGRVGYEDEFEEADVAPENVLNRRDVPDRKIDCYTIDGARVLEHQEWLGRWIPIVPVLGAEKIVDGKRQFVSLIRYVHDPQKLLNAYKTGMATNIGIQDNSPWVGVKGSFKDSKWRDARPSKYLEYEPVSIDGQPAPPPQRNIAEPPIQALTMAAMAEADDIKAGMGYVDNLVAPSRNDLSGIAVQRRSHQAELTNYHFQDNLERSQWHCARILLDLIPKVIDTPRIMRILGKDGSVSQAVVGLQAHLQQNLMNGQNELPGFAGQRFHLLDAGRYDVTVTSGPSYTTKIEQQTDEMTEMFQANPTLFPLYADIWFKLKGYDDLAERAEIMLPPQVAQAQQAKAQGVPPQAAAQIAQLSAQNQQLQQGIQQVMQILQSKQVEVQGKIAVEQAKTAGNLAVEHTKAARELAVGEQQAHHQTNLAMHEAAHETNMRVMDATGEAIRHLAKMLHETEMAPHVPQIAGTQPPMMIGAPRRQRPNFAQMQQQWPIQ